MENIHSDEIIEEDEELLPGYPPDDYSGSIADWMVELERRGFWDGTGWYGDVEIPKKAYMEILAGCEK